jgi:hypothetical protein
MSQAEIAEMERETGCLVDREGILPTVLPVAWVERRHTEAQRMWIVHGPGGPLSVIAGLERHGGKRWIHVSCARHDRLPSYVNIHPHCTHLFICIDDDPVPCFTRIEAGERTL